MALPRKTVRLVELEFSREEQIVYEAYLSEGRQLIMRQDLISPVLVLSCFPVSDFVTFSDT